MRWPDGVLRSPVDGAPLRHDRPHALTDGRRRWPVVDRVPLLLEGRRAWLDLLLDLLDAGEDRRARAVLLGREGVEDGDVLRDRMLAGGPSMRDALERLGADPDARHAHDPLLPDHLAALALLGSRHGGGPVAVLGCGAGLLVRAVARAGVETVGVDADPVLLWVARRFGAPNARLVAAAGADQVRVLPDRTFGTAVVTARWPVAPGADAGAPGAAADALLAARGELRRVALAWVAVGLSPSAGLAAAGLAGAPVEALAAGLVEAGGARTGPVAGGEPEERWGVSGSPGGGTLDLSLPPAGASLRRNPLLLPLPGGAPGEWAAAWPTPAQPPGAAWTLGRLTPVTIPREHRERAEARSGPAVDELARRRVLVDLPARW